MLFDTRRGQNGLVCDMVVSVDGDILAYQFYEATIRSELVLHMKIFGKSLRMMI